MLNYPNNNKLSESIDYVPWSNLSDSDKILSLADLLGDYDNNIFYNDHDDNSNIAIIQAKYGLMALLPVISEGNVKVAIIYDEKAINIVGGTFTAGAWRQRDLNTKLDPDSLVTVASNQVTIAIAGKYWVRGHAPSGYGTYYHQVRLLVNNSQVALGTSEDSIASHVITRSFVNYVATLNANDVLKLEHQAYATVASYGFGISNTWGTNIYSVMELIKLD